MSRKIVLKKPNLLECAQVLVVEEVSMTWIGRQSVTELEVSLKWIELNRHILKNGHSISSSLVTFTVL